MLKVVLSLYLLENQGTCLLYVMWRPLIPLISVVTREILLTMLITWKYPRMVSSCKVCTTWYNFSRRTPLFFHVKWHWQFGRHWWFILTIRTYDDMLSPRWPAILHM